MIVYGAGMGDGDIHSQINMPIAVLGGASGKIKGGRYIRSPENTPFANLHVAMLNIAGIPTKTFGDSTGELDLNSAAIIVRPDHPTQVAKTRDRFCDCDSSAIKGGSYREFRLVGLQ